VIFTAQIEASRVAYAVSVANDMTAQPNDFNAQVTVVKASKTEWNAIVIPTASRALSPTVNDFVEPVPAAPTKTTNDTGIAHFFIFSGIGMGAALLLGALGLRLVIRFMGGGSDSDHLRKELQELKPKLLIKRAKKTAGIDEGALADAIEEDDMDDIIELIIEVECPEESMFQPQGSAVIEMGTFDGAKGNADDDDDDDDDGDGDGSDDDDDEKPKKKTKKEGKV